MKVKLDSPNEDIQISIVPLIDVIFCILTFFLLAAVQFTRQQAINVDLPKASTGTSSAANSQSRQNILPVTIDAVGLTYIEKELVKPEDLEAKLRQYVKNNPNVILVLNASRTATYNDVIQTLDLMRKVGGNRVSLGIIPGGSNGTNSSESSSRNNSQTVPNLQPSLPVLPNNQPNNQLGNINPQLPSNSNQVPIIPNGNSGTYVPVLPNRNVPQNPVQQLPVAPGTSSPSNNSPSRN